MGSRFVGGGHRPFVEPVPHPTPQLATDLNSGEITISNFYLRLNFLQAFLPSDSCILNVSEDNFDVILFLKDFLISGQTLPSIPSESVNY